MKRVIFMIVIDNVSKTLKGNKVLDNIDYVFEEGKIYDLNGEMLLQQAADDAVVVVGFLDETDVEKPCS